MTRILAARIAKSANVLPPPPQGLIGRRYQWSFSISGISQPYRYKIAGTLPPGLDWYPDTRTLFGVPAAHGSYPVTINVVGADRIPIAFPFVIVIADTPLMLLGSLESGEIGTMVNGALVVVGGTPGYVLLGIDGIPPSGITFAMTSGVITASGLTTLAGTFRWQFLIRDSDGTEASISYSLTVGAVTSRTRYVDETGNTYIDASANSYVSNTSEI